MKFAVDCMLGKLAKWLRILGFDAVFFGRIEDDDLLDVARGEGRVLLTRDNELLQRAGKEGIDGLFIESGDRDSQVVQVLDDLKLRNDIRPHSRCLECNMMLKTLPRDRARNMVSPFVFSRASGFSLCPGCGRVFWKGTHLKDMHQKIEGWMMRAEKPAAVPDGKKNAD